MYPTKLLVDIADVEEAMSTILTILNSLGHMEIDQADTYARLQLARQVIVDIRADLTTNTLVWNAEKKELSLFDDIPF
jgi:hypothetical protein